MAMIPRFYGPTCLRFDCRIHDIRAVLDEHNGWGEARLSKKMRAADPHTVVALEWDLARPTASGTRVGKRAYILHGDGDKVVGRFPARLLAKLSEYNYHVGI